MTDDFPTSHSKPSAMEPQLDTEVSDSSDVTTAGSDGSDEVESDLVNATIYLRFVSSDSSVYAVSYSSGFDRICLTDLIKSSTATIRHQRFTSHALHHKVRYLVRVSSRTRQILPM